MTSYPDYADGDTRYFFFTSALNGVPSTLGGTPVISAYEDNSITQITTGVSISADFDGVTGLNLVTVDMSQADFEDDKSYSLVITTGTIDGTSVAGTVVGGFTLGASPALKPTVGGRTLDVSAGGEAGIDWANIGSPTTAQNLSGTNIDTDQTVGLNTGAISTTSFASGAIDAAALATDAVNELADGHNARQMTEGYAADTVAPTLEQMLFMLWAFIQDHGFVGTTKTSRKLDNTTAMTHTLDDATNPTDITRAT